MNQRLGLDVPFSPSAQLAGLICIRAVLQGDPKTWGTSRENPLTGDQKIAKISTREQGDDDDDGIYFI